MLRRLYDWAMVKVSGPEGEKWLAVLSFAESSLFPIPVDLLLLPMLLADHMRAWRLALITTAFSVLGALMGYLIGALFFETIARPVLTVYGYMDSFNRFGDYYAEYGLMIVLVAGLTPIPFKVVTIASGVFGLNPVLFGLICIPARAPRFFAEAALFRLFGPGIRGLIERYFNLVMIALVIVGIAGFFALKLI